MGVQIKFQVAEVLWANGHPNTIKNRQDASDLVDRSGLGVRYGYVIPEHLKMRCHPDLPGPLGRESAMGNKKVIGTNEITTSNRDTTWGGDGRGILDQVTTVGA